MTSAVFFVGAIHESPEDLHINKWRIAIQSAPSVRELSSASETEGVCTKFYHI